MKLGIDLSENTLIFGEVYDTYIVRNTRVVPNGLLSHHRMRDSDLTFISNWCPVRTFQTL